MDKVLTFNKVELEDKIREIVAKARTEFELGFVLEKQLEELVFFGEYALIKIEGFKGELEFEILKHNDDEFEITFFTHTPYPRASLTLCTIDEINEWIKE